MDKVNMESGLSLKRKALKIGLALLAFIIVIGAAGVFYMTRGLEEGRRLEISAVAPSGELFGRVIEAQNTTVDVISGATVSRKAYLKSIENALTE